MAHNSTHTIERVARVLAGERLSGNAEGTALSAGDAVDSSWSNYRAEAVAVLKSLREPPPEVAALGVGQEWARAIAAALGDETGPVEDSPLQQAAESVEHSSRHRPRPRPPGNRPDIPRQSTRLPAACSP